MGGGVFVLHEQYMGFHQKSAECGESIEQHLVLAFVRLSLSTQPYSIYINPNIV